MPALPVCAPGKAALTVHHFRNSDTGRWRKLFLFFSPILADQYSLLLQKFTFVKRDKMQKLTKWAQTENSIEQHCWSWHSTVFLPNARRKGSLWTSHLLYFFLTCWRTSSETKAALYKLYLLQELNLEEISKKQVFSLPLSLLNPELFSPKLLSVHWSRAPHKQGEVMKHASVFPHNTFQTGLILPKWKGKEVSYKCYRYVTDSITPLSTYARQWKSGMCTKVKWHNR